MGRVEVKHKWHKEIKAWADGAEIQHKYCDKDWIDVKTPAWSQDLQFRIKPQPKEPQYLYVWDSDGNKFFSKNKYGTIIPSNNPASVSYLGKIKLEQEE